MILFLITLRRLTTLVIVACLIVGIPLFFTEQGWSAFYKQQKEIAGECGVIPIGDVAKSLGPKCRTSSLDIDSMTSTGIYIKGVVYNSEGELIDSSSSSDTVLIKYEDLPDFLPKYRKTAECMMKKYSQEQLEDALKNKVDE